MMNTGALERAELSETPHKAQPVGKIAGYILKYGDGLGYDFDGLQLLKLAYIAHGFRGLSRTIRHDSVCEIT